MFEQFGYKNFTGSQSPGRRAGHLLRLRHVAQVSAATVLTAGLWLSASAAQAALLYTGGIGETVYGVSGYGGGAQVTPKFIADNVSGNVDILASPGGTFQRANPIIANNIFQTPVINNLPLSSFKIGGGNVNGAFGRGFTQIVGPNIGFSLADSGPGGGSLSYSISTFTSNFTVTAGGFNGNLGTFLAIGGVLPAVGSSAVASLVSDYYVNGVNQGLTTPLILADSGTGSFVASGGSGAALLQGAGGSFRGLAIDNIFATLAAGATVKVTSTLTELADPASIDSIVPDLDLINATGTTLPTGVLAGDISGVPLPPGLPMFGSALACLGLGGLWRRRRAAV